jgi:hypothetical protein
MAAGTWIATAVIVLFIQGGVIQVIRVNLNYLDVNRTLL